MDPIDQPDRLSIDEVEARLADFRSLMEEVSVASAGACSLVPVIAAIVEAAALVGITSAPSGR